MLEAALLLVAAYAPWRHDILGAAAVLPSLWLILVSGAAAMLSLEEFRKWIVRRALDRGADH